MYKQDIKREDLAKEREVVKRYLDATDEILFGGYQDGVRGWERERIKHEKERKGRGRRLNSLDNDRNGSPERSRSKRRVVSTGILDSMREMVLSEEPDGGSDTDAASEAESVDDEQLPDWAKRAMFEDDPMGKRSRPQHYFLLLSILRLVLVLFSSSSRAFESPPPCISPTSPPSTPRRPSNSIPSAHFRSTSMHRIQYRGSQIPQTLGFREQRCYPRYCGFGVYG